MHSIYYLLALLICILYCPPTLAIETEDTTSHDAVPTVRSPKPARGRRLGGAAELFLKEHHRRSKSSDDRCPTNYAQCGSGLPSGFCCASGNSCLSLADATAVLCCPVGEDCAQIEPITCNIAVQNATAYPTLAVHTTNLNGQLPTCGSGCCPFGYTCSSSGSNVCVRAKEDDALIAETTSSVPPTATVTSAVGTGTVLVMASVDATKSAPVPTGIPSSLSSPSDEDDDKDSSSSGASSRTIGIAAGSAVAGIASVAAIIVFTWTRKRRRAAGPSAAESRGVRVSVSQFSPTPPPLPEKEPHQVPKRKRKSLLSWVPSIINRTPAELPATPVSFSAWNTPWGQGQVQRPNGVLRPYPRESLAIEEVHELEATWLPQERLAQERHTPDVQTQEWYAQNRYL